MQPGDVIEVKVVGNSRSDTYSNHFEIDVAADNPFAIQDHRELPPGTTIIWKQVDGDRVVDHIAIGLAPARKKSKGSRHTRYEEWIEEPSMERTLRVRVRLAAPDEPIFVPPVDAEGFPEIDHSELRTESDDTRWIEASAAIPVASPLQEESR